MVYKRRHHEEREHHRDRKPRQPEGPPPNVASSSSGGNPVKLEPIAVDSDGDWYQSDGERPGAEWLAHDK